MAPHYARTLREWRHRFEASLEQVRTLGYDERPIGTCHLLLAKPAANPLPLTGAL